MFGGPGQPKQSKLDFEVLSKEEKAAQMTIESIDHKANKEKVAAMAHLQSNVKDDIAKMWGLSLPSPASKPSK